MHAQEQCLVTDNSRQSPPTSSANGGQKLTSRGGYHRELWQETQRILVYLMGKDPNALFRAYAEYLSGLLEGQTTYRLDKTERNLARFRRDASDFDLVLYGEPEQSTLEKALFGTSGRCILKNAPTAVLIARRPSWPICNILLVLRVESSEEPAIEWAGRLAYRSGANLTILPLVPFQPLLYGAGSQLQVGIESLLMPGTPSGERLRSFLVQLRRWQVNGKVHVRQGDPLWQICWEIEEGNYDLIVLGAEHQSRLRRWLFGQLVVPLACRTDRPLLIASQRRPVANKLIQEEKTRSETYDK